MFCCFYGESMTDFRWRISRLGRYVLLQHLAVVLILQLQTCWTAELVIHIPGNLNQDGVTGYRLDFYPPFGHPEPKTTIASKDIHDVITFSRALPGTKYDFWLYYSNSTHDTLTWTANFTTEPDPPSNLSVTVRSGKTAVITWRLPSQGSYSTFKLKINALSNTLDSNPLTISVDAVETSSYVLRDLTPGATYEVQAYTVFENKESAAFTSRNFTTKPNTPGNSIVWFRNETTLLVLWQPPSPPAIYTHYKFSIEPQDAIDNVLYIEKEGEPPQPARAAFKGLFPGRAYNISAQTMSEDETSTPTTAQYRTVPLRPLNITFDKASITSNSFIVHWDPPNGKSEFDKYQISLGSVRNQPAVTKLREETLIWKFKDNLEPGKTYQVIVKTVSGKVTSWPMSADVTLKPLPVLSMRADIDEKSNTVNISWTANSSSFQESFVVFCHEVESSSGYSNTVQTNETRIALDTLLPGRNYSIAIQAISNRVESNESYLYVVTRPSAPIIEDLLPLVDGLNVCWKSNVNSRQDKFEVECVSNDTKDNLVRATNDYRIVLRDLYPGAGYIVKVFAISHGRRSETHEYFQSVYPRPPENITIDKTTINSVVVQWVAPTDSLVSEYTIKYRTDTERTWVRLLAVANTEAKVTDMTPGERYTIQVNTVSYGLESNEPQQLNHTVRPNPVSNIVPLIDSNNVTLEWPRPEGRVDIYIVRWWEAAPNGQLQINKRNVTQNGNFTGPVRLLVGELMPGVDYDFDIQTISNDLESDITQLKIRTIPDPPSKLSVMVMSGKTAVITWRPPSQGRYSTFKLKINALSYILDSKPLSISVGAVETSSYVLRDLTPGATYQVQAYTVFENKESAAYISRNFTTKPNAPGKSILWFRNETTLLVLWQPPYPPAIYTHYKFSIAPPDAIDSVLYVEKEGVRPGPVQAVFKGLVPGRAYNISAQTMSEDEISTLTTVQYRAVPLRPLNITFDKASITSNSFIVHWDPPNGKSEFNKYQISLGSVWKQPAVTRLREETPIWKFKDNLEPGKTYQVIVKTVSGKVTSWPISADVTLKPLPVLCMRADIDEKSKTVNISWMANPSSFQEGFLVSYHEVDSSSGDSNTVQTNETRIALDMLLPGRNYSIAVQAISKRVESNERSLYVVTRPSAPIIEDLWHLVDGLNISSKSDVNSPQDKFEVECVRNDTKDNLIKATNDYRIVSSEIQNSIP